MGWASEKIRYRDEKKHNNERAQSDPYILCRYAFFDWLFSSALK